MFAPPADISTSLFARLPDKLRRTGRSEWADQNKHGAEIDSFLEGPCLDGEGNLYVTDIPWGRIFRVDPNGEWSTFLEYDGWPNGLKFDSQDTLYIADYKRGILAVDMRSKAINVVVDSWRSEHLKGTNDLFFSPTGDLWFTDQGQTGVTDPTGRVFCWNKSSGLRCLSDRVPSPNGIVLDRTGLAVFVATRENAIWSLPIHPGIGTSKARVYIQLSGGGGPDGLARTANEQLAVCHTGLGSVWLFSSLGEPVARFRSCAGRSTTNLAISGDAMQRMFITESESGSILVADLPPNA